MTTQGEHIKRVKEFVRQPYTWPGIYPQYAICADGGALCHTCTKKELGLIVTSIAQDIQDGWNVGAIDVNWENTELYCDHCSQQIESAYAD